MSLKIQSDNFIAIIDYGLGNTESVGNALGVLGYKFLITNVREEIEKASAIIIPGVGSFGEAMRNLEKYNLIEVLNNEVLIKKKNVLGICLGMQIFAETSEEDLNYKGLGWIPGGVIRIHSNKKYRVPHVGWNNLEIKIKSPLFEKNTISPDFYFDHSYYFDTTSNYISAVCDYGCEITAAIQKDNIYGVQFHPEKSQIGGLKLLRSFFNKFNIEY